MKKSTLITGLILLILVSGIGIVSAETVSGTLGTGETGWSSWNYILRYGTTSQATTFDALNVMNIQSTSNMKSLVCFSNASNGYKPQYPDNATMTGNSTPLIINSSGTTIGTGTIGFYRVFTGTPPVEQYGGFIYIIFDTWDPGVLTGTVKVQLVYDHAAMQSWNSIIFGSNTAYNTPTDTGYMYFASNTYAYNYAGDYTFNRDLDFLNGYLAVKPSGLGITGNISKTIDDKTYPSQVFILDGTTGNILTSDYTISPIDKSFNVPSQTIKIAILSDFGVWYNTSTLFSAGWTPTPTPTPTQPIGPDNPIPAGYIRTMAQCVDGQTSGSIHDCHLDLYDVENTSWSNGSYLDMGSYYGTWWIDTLPGHTINAYASSTGYTPVSRLNLPASSTYMYELILWPTSIPAAGSGFVNLYVLVHDADSGNAITGAAVQVRILDGTTYAQTTGTSGSRMFEVPNSSYTSVTVTKYGYISATRGITTSASGDDTLRIELQRKVITTVPTQTIPPGGVTTAVTMDPRTASEKDRDMMDQIRDAGPTLIQLAIAATALGLLGLIMKSIK